MATSKKRELVIRMATLGSLLSFFIFVILYSKSSSVDIPTFHLDGAYQTASSLFRLDSGQVPGRDFFPYLGIGPLITIYPFFKILGGDLSDSVFASQFVTLALGWISVSVLWHFIFRPGKSTFALLGGAIAFILPLIFANYTSMPNVFWFAFEPGNSLRPVRAAAPYLVAIAYYIIIKRNKNLPRQAFFVGILISVTLLWSNDYAIPTAGLFSVLYCVHCYCDGQIKWRTGIAIFIITILISAPVLLTLATLGHPLELIKYNFIDVAQDQWWFFGYYRDSDRIFAFSQLMRLLSLENYFPIAILLITSFVAIKTKKFEHILLTWIGLTLFAGGALASVGGHIGGYFRSFVYWGAATTFLVYLNIILHLLLKLTSSRRQQINMIESKLSVFLFCSLFCLAAYKWHGFNSNLTDAKNDSDRIYVDELGGFLGSEWATYLTYAYENKNKAVFEDYWGIWSSLNKSFSSWPVDSVIHALGETRNDAKLKLKFAEIIVSTRYDTSPRWQPWSVSQNFWFYEDLLINWVPVLISPTTIVWERNVGPRSFREVNCRVSKEGNDFILDTDIDGFYSVSLNYRLSGTGRYLAMLRNNISYAGYANGYVSLPPGKSITTIPALATKNTGNIFDAKVIGNDDIQFVIESCVAQRISYENGQLLNIKSPNEFFMPSNNNNWVNGIAQNHSGFFDENTENSRKKYKAGKLIKFKNDDSREITDVVLSEQYILVFLEGPVLDSDSVGFPTEFEVIDNP